jgi:hypothetical protein
MTTTSGAGLVLACIVLASSFIGCPLLKKKAGADAGEEEVAAPADAATVEAAGLGAKNEANVLRYANETPLDSEPAVIGAAGAKVRSFPGNGPEVATLPKGTPVAKIAQYFNTGVLVMFDDPSGDGSKLMGWVPPKVFDVAAPVPTKIIVPPATRDAGAPLVHDGGAAPKDAGAAHDAGVAPKDAGAAHVDAGVAPKDAGAARVDAGGGGSALPQPPKGAVAVPPVNGKCPDGWTVTSGMCRRKCAADAECPRGTRCLSKGAATVCTSG